MRGMDLQQPAASGLGGSRRIRLPQEESPRYGGRTSSPSDPFQASRGCLNSFDISEIFTPWYLRTQRPAAWRRTGV